MPFVDEMFFKYVHMDSVVYCIFIFVIFSSVTADTITLRRSNYDGVCASIIVQTKCQLKCGFNNGCWLGRCICFKGYTNTTEPANVTTTSITEETTVTTEGVGQKTNSTGGVNVSTENSKKGYDAPISRLVQELNYTIILPMNMNTSAGKPALRHHVAHFCPNLDEARACIRKCMRYGAPAFCGKDHICYCGHRYGQFDDSNEINTTIDPDENPYKDLYDHYFGPKSTSTTTHTPASTTTTTPPTTTTPTTTTEDMTARDIMEWVPTNITNALDHKKCAVIAGYKGFDGIPQMVIRATINKALVPGKLPENDKAAYVGWDRKQHKVLDFEMCCVRNKEEITWKTVKFGNIPEKAVVAGYTADGVDLYIGRAAVRGELTSGAVHSVNKVIHVASDGKEVIENAYDVLVRNL